MARNILIIDHSASMRRIISNMVLANIDEAVVSQAADIESAVAMIQEQQFNVFLFSWDGADKKTLDFFQTTKENPQNGKKIPVVALVDGEKEHDIVAIKNAGVSQCVKVPCTPQSLADAINLACNPVNMRSAKRFSIPGTTAVLEQGESILQAEVVNISSSGMLCELDCPSRFLFDRQTVISLSFNVEGRQVKAADLHGTLTGMKVIDRTEDFIPKKIRLAFLFVKVPEESAKELARIFVFAEQQQNMF